MQLSAVLAIGVALLPSLAVAVNPWGFTSTCQGYRLDEGRKLVASCLTVKKRYLTTRQDLNLCLGNSKGHLVSVDNGKFAESCRLCHLNGVTITCLCHTGTAAGEFETSFDLDQIMNNRDGYMWCQGHRAAPI